MINKGSLTFTVVNFNIVLYLLIKLINKYEKENRKITEK